MINIIFNKNYIPEIEYICRIIFSDFLDIEYNIKYTHKADRNHWEIHGENGRSIILPNIFFQTTREQWLSSESLPIQPLSIWDLSSQNISCPLVDPKIPIIYGDLNFKSNKDNEHKHFFIPIDIFGSAFFMLTRYEEVVKLDRDEHSRFPAKASLAFQENFLDRPIINEYIEILWFYLRQICGTEKRKNRTFKIIPTHDVDNPYHFYFNPAWKKFKSLTGDLIKRKNIKLFSNNALSLMKGTDPYNTFDMIMSFSEQADLKSSFYFMAGGKTRFDPSYPIAHPKMIELINKIHQRGHYIGFHPSYEAGFDENIWQDEFTLLQKTVGNIPLRGGREHYLRFRTPLTWRFWADSSLEYDSSLCFADMAGFRCGICYPYPIYDLEERKILNIIERPLILMECSVLDKQYMNLGHSQEAIDYMFILKKRCQIFHGEFVLLWHNNRFIDNKEIIFYKNMIEAYT